jgi:hypothetical protein
MVRLVLRMWIEYQGKKIAAASRRAPRPGIA